MHFVGLSNKYVKYTCKKHRIPVLCWSENSGFGNFLEFLKLRAVVLVWPVVLLLHSN